MIFANDPSVKAGAMTVYVAEKWKRAIEISRENKIPFISFVESAGSDLIFIEKLKDITYEAIVYSKLLKFSF
mgnify:CR=1 FL=1